MKLQKLARQDKLSYKREDKQENLHIVVFSKDGVKKIKTLYYVTFIPAVNQMWPPAHYP